MGQQGWVLQTNSAWPSQTCWGGAAIDEVVFGGLSMRHSYTWVHANEVGIVEGPGIVAGLGVFDNLGIVEGQDEVKDLRV